MQTGNATAPQVGLDGADIAYEICRRPPLVERLAGLLVGYCAVQGTVVVLPLASILTRLCEQNESTKLLLAQRGVLEAAAAWWTADEATGAGFAPSVGCETIEVALGHAEHHPPALGLTFWPAADRYQLVKQHRGHGLLVMPPAPPRELG